MQTSAKTGFGVPDLFTEMGTRLLNKYKKREAFERRMSGMRNRVPTNVGGGKKLDPSKHSELASE